MMLHADHMGRCPVLMHTFNAGPSVMALGNKVRL